MIPARWTDASLKNTRVANRRSFCAAIGVPVALSLIWICATAVPLVEAQDIVGRMSGTVTDTTGAVVPGANVTITNKETGVSRPPHYHQRQRLLRGR